MLLFWNIFVLVLFCSSTCVSSSDVCSGKKIDVVMVNDISKSIDSSTELPLVRELLNSIVKGLDVGSGKTRVGSVVFGNVAKQVYNLASPQSHGIFDKFDFIPREKRVAGTMTNLGMKAARSMMEINKRVGVPQVMMVVTDGRSTDNMETVREANSIHNNTGMTVIAVGVGLITQNDDQDELSDIATGEGDQNVLLARSYKKLAGLKEKLLHMICSAPLEPTEKANCPSLCLNRGSIHGYTFAGETVKFECDPGWEREGPAQSTCQKDGTWTDPVPECKYIRRCPHQTGTFGGKVQFIPGAKHRNDYRRVGGQVKYTCDEGYQMVGQDTVTCEIIDAKGHVRWEPRAPSCVYAKCSAMKWLKNGKIVSQNINPGGVVKFACNPGYVLDGKDSLTCFDRKWVGSKPTCKKSGCKPHSFLKYGSVTPANEAAVGTKSVFSCPVGYKLKGNKELTCLSTNQWTSDKPQCVYQRCNWVSFVTDGVIKREGNPVTHMTITCNPGFKLTSGSGVVMCVNGKWDKPIPQCKEHLCKRISRVWNAEVENYGRSVGHTIKIKCSPGFKLKSNCEEDCYATCQEDLKWTPIPTCTKDYSVPVAQRSVECPNINDIGNGRCTGSRKDGGTLNCECDPGFILDGPSTLKCTKNSWNGRTPYCKDNRCPYLSQLYGGKNEITGRYPGATATFSCFDGFKLEGGDAILTCQKNGQWSGKAPICKFSRCASLLNIENGKVVENKDNIGDTITFECNAGFRLDGPSSLTCGKDRSWGKSIPRCVKNTCDPREYVSNGRMKGSDLSIGAKLKVECDEGYVLGSSEYITCQADLTWSEEPKCIYNLCSNPRSVARGKILNFNMAAGSTITYECDFGNSLKGTKSITCMADGEKRKWSHPYPSCIENRTCPTLCLARGKADYDGKYLEDYYKTYFTCNEGYRLLGDYTATCLPTSTPSVGKWSKELPKCTNKIPQACFSTVMDIVFVVQNSNSLNTRNLAKMKNMLSKLIDSYQTPSKTRIGVVEYNNEATVKLGVEKSSKKEMFAGLSIESYFKNPDKKGNELSKGLKAVQDYFKSHKQINNNVRVVVVTYESLASAELAQVQTIVNEMKSGTKPKFSIFAIGIGQKDKTTTTKITGNAANTLDYKKFKNAKYDVTNIVEFVKKTC